jgi:hypothetical protein
MVERAVNPLDSAPWLLPLVVVLGAILVFVRQLRRSTELFVIAAEADGARLLRGRIPPQLLNEIREIVRRSNSRGELRVVVEWREPVIEARGEFSAGTLQQLRNVIGNTPVQRIRSGAGPTR